MSKWTLRSPIQLRSRDKQGGESIIVRVTQVSPSTPTSTPICSQPTPSPRPASVEDFNKLLPSLTPKVLENQSTHTPVSDRDSSQSVSPLTPDIEVDSNQSVHSPAPGQVVDFPVTSPGQNSSEFQSKKLGTPLSNSQVPSVNAPVSPVIDRNSELEVRDIILEGEPGSSSVSAPGPAADRNSPISVLVTPSSSVDKLSKMETECPPANDQPGSGSGGQDSESWCRTYLTGGSRSRSEERLPGSRKKILIEDCGEDMSAERQPQRLWKDSRRDGPEPTYRDRSPQGRCYDADQGAQETKEDQEARKMGELFSEAFEKNGLAQSEVKLARAEAGTCNGSSTKETLKWLRKISEYSNPCTIALNLSKGALREFVQELKHKDWKRMFREIAEAFVSSAFELSQRQHLESLCQRPEEPVRIFNYEFRKLYEEGYPNPTNETEKHAIWLYLSNIQDRGLGVKLLKKCPRDLRQAMEWVEENGKFDEILKPRKKMKGNVAMVSEELEGMQQQIFDLQREMAATQIKGAPSSPEIVVPVTKREKKGLEKDFDEFRSEIRSKFDDVAYAIQQNKQETPPVNGRQNQGPRDQNTPVKRCYNCGQPGHMSRDCSKKSPKCPFCLKQGHTEPDCFRKQKGIHPVGAKVKPGVQFDPTRRCRRCRKSGHHSVDCDAGFPPNPCRKCQGNHWTDDCGKGKDSENGTETLN